MRRSGAHMLARVLLATTALTAASSAAMAQSYVWGGTGSTTTTSDFSAASNWSDPPVGGPPAGSYQDAVFSSTGNSQVTFDTVTNGKWTFDADAQSYTMTGGTFAISHGHPYSGIYNNANAGQSITLAMNVNGYSYYPDMRLVQNGNSTLTIAGTFDFYGQVAINAGRLVVASGGTLSVTNDYEPQFAIVNNATLEAQAGSRIVTNGWLVNTGTVTIAGEFRSQDIRNRGDITFSGGANAYINAYFVSGEAANNTNSLTVTGPGTTLSMGSDLIMGGWDGAVSTLRITDGAVVSSNNGGLGHGANTTVTGLVSGPGSRWQTSFQMYVGLEGSGTLTVENGGTAWAWAYNCCDPLGAGVILMGVTADAVGKATVTGAGSILGADTTITVGYGGTATLTAREGGAVISQSIKMATLGGSTGTINIGGEAGQAAVAPGSVSATSINVGAGTAQLVFNHTASNYVFAPSIYNVEGGSLSLLVESGTTRMSSGLSGPATATINGGRLDISSNFSGTAMTVNAGGTFSGSGEIGKLTVNAGGAFRPDAAMTVNGDFTMSAGATFTTLFKPLTVTGTATLGGANLAYKAASFSDQTYTVLTATGGVSGTFVPVPEGITVGTLTYNANDVQLTVKGFRTGAALFGEGTTNSRNLGAGLDRAANAGAVFPAAVDALTALSGAPLASALGKLTGEAGTGATSTGLTGASTFLGIMLDPMGGSRGGTASAPGSSLVEMADLGAGRTPAARVEAAWSLWTRAYGQAGRTASDAGLGAAGTASSIYGVAAGADKLVSPGLVVGFALAGGGTSFGLGALGSGTGDFAQLGAYASMRLGPGYLSAALAYGWNRFDVTRNVAAVGVTETYRSSPVGHTFGGRIEAGRRFALGTLGTIRFAVTPYAAAEAIAYLSPSYRESWIAPATGAFALTYSGRTTGTLRAELGARADALVASAESGDLIAFSRLAYAVQTNPQRAAEAQFQALAGSTFTVFGTRASTHTALGTLGIEARYRQGLTASVALDGEVGDRHRALRGSVGLRQSW
jgi:T5SS/PEP-CTERM-associated repeat protein